MLPEPVPVEEVPPEPLPDVLPLLVPDEPPLDPVPGAGFATGGMPLMGPIGFVPATLAGIGWMLVRLIPLFPGGVAVNVPGEVVATGGMPLMRPAWVVPAAVAEIG